MSKAIEKAQPLIERLHSFLNNEAKHLTSHFFEEQILRLAQDQNEEQNLLMLNTLKSAMGIMNTKYTASWVFYGYAPKTDEYEDTTVCLIPINNGGVAVVFHNWEVRNIPVPKECPVSEALEMSGLPFLENAAL